MLRHVMLRESLFDCGASTSHIWPLQCHQGATVSWQLCKAPADHRSDTPKFSWPNVLGPRCAGEQLTKRRPRRSLWCSEDIGTKPPCICRRECHDLRVQGCYVDAALNAPLSDLIAENDCPRLQYCRTVPKPARTIAAGNHDSYLPLPNSVSTFVWPTSMISRVQTA